MLSIGMMVMTEFEQARLNLLKHLTADIATFAIPIACYLDPAEQVALEWLQRNRWITLIDLSPISAMPGGLFRIYLASAEAISWMRRQS